MMRIVFWGTYDMGKPRTRILLRGLRENRVSVIECHADVWGGIEDKSQITGWMNRLRFALLWLLQYPRLIIRYIALPKHDVVVVGYLGHLDVLVLWLFALLRGVPIVWDAFLSLYETVVEDRRLVSPNNPLAFVIFLWEWLSCRAANLIILDTQAHADYFVQRFKVPVEKTGVVFVGVETDVFPPPTKSVSQKHAKGIFTVLFYGQFIPLHGIETIIKAAQQIKHAPINWIIIGHGQEEQRIEKILKEEPLWCLTWIPWVPYRELVAWIYRADICLGIFGDSEKAARVIPNKVFQILSAGKPIITEDSPAIRELLNPEIPGVNLIPPADPSKLAYTVQTFFKQKPLLAKHRLYTDVLSKIEPIAIGKMFISQILYLTQFSD
jgi:glycosyltransferase involved in cell wall biosynthesis